MHQLYQYVILSMIKVTPQKQRHVSLQVIPNHYTFYKWQHKSKHGTLIIEFDGGQNGILTLPSIPVEDRYRGIGEYVCTAGNGIVGRDGNVKQTESGYVTINGMQNRKYVTIS